MTMTAGEEKVLRNYVAKAVPCGTIYHVLQVLANVALKEAAIKAAQGDERAQQVIGEEG